MHNFFSLTRSAISTLLACLIAMSSALSSTALAQSDPEVDLQPPVINFEAVEIGNAGEVQVFTADITEEQALVSAVFFHRFTGDEEYIRTDMRQLSDTTLFSVSVSTDRADVRDIEYYIQAEDSGGNRAIKGFVFDPLVRKIQVPEANPVATDQEPAPGMSTNRKLLWGLLGLLAVGLIAGAAGGGGGGGETPVGPTTPVNIIFNPDAN